MSILKKMSYLVVGSFFVCGPLMAMNDPTDPDAADQNLSSLPHCPPDAEKIAGEKDMQKEKPAPKEPAGGEGGEGGEGGAPA